MRTRELGSRSPAALAAIAILATCLACGLQTVSQGEPPSVSVSPPEGGTAVQVGQEVVIRSQATDDKGVVRVELWASGVLVRSDASPVSGGQTPYLVAQPWRPEVAGTHTLVVKAFDAEGGAVESAPLVFDVQPAGEVPSATPVPPPTAPATAEATDLPPSATPPPSSVPTEPATPTATPTPTPTPTPPPDQVPQLRITAPTSPAQVLLGSVVRVKMRASDDKGLARIELFADGVLYRKDEVGGSKAVEWSIDWTPPALGTYVLEARALDTALQPSAPARLEVRVEAGPAPTVPAPYGAVWRKLGGLSSGLGSPVGAPASRSYAGQEFDHAFMFWQELDSPLDDQIYVIYWGAGDDQGSGPVWSAFPDDWKEGRDPDYSCAEAVPPIGPRRGFGLVWCSRSEVRTAAGAALQEEFGTDGGWLDFQGGLMLWDAMNGRIFVLFDSGAWQAWPDNLP